MKELNEEKLKNSSKKFRVNDVTAFLGITPRILKHYESTGILNPERTDGNSYRAYSAEDVIKVQLGERLKCAQLSQREIGEYFSGELDIQKKCDELIRLRETIDDLIDVLDVDLKDGTPRFSVLPEISLPCFCKAYPATHDFLQIYLNARDVYSAALSAGCVCDVSHTFFSAFDDFASFPHVVGTHEMPDKATYRVCVPIIAPPKTDGFDGTAETVTRKKSLAIKFASRSIGSAYILPQEASKRGLTLTGKMWAVTETGPNKKTANHTYTFIVGAEIEE